MEELELLTKQAFNPLMMKDLIQKCPIELKIPLSVKRFIEENNDDRIIIEENQMRQERIITDFNKYMSQKAVTPRNRSRLERENQWELNALRDYFREYGGSERSCNVDDTNRTLSVMDESEA